MAIAIKRYFFSILLFFSLSTFDSVTPEPPVIESGWEQQNSNQWQQGNQWQWEQPASNKWEQQKKLPEVHPNHYLTKELVKKDKVLSKHLLPSSFFKGLPGVAQNSGGWQEEKWSSAGEWQPKEKWSSGGWQPEEKWSSAGEWQPEEKWSSGGWQPEEKWSSGGEWQREDKWASTGGWQQDQWSSTGGWQDGSSQSSEWQQPAASGWGWESWPKKQLTYSEDLTIPLQQVTNAGPWASNSQVSDSYGAPQQAKWDSDSSSSHYSHSKSLFTEKELALLSGWSQR